MKWYHWIWAFLILCAIYAIGTFVHNLYWGAMAFFSKMTLGLIFGIFVVIFIYIAVNKK